jgi:hypothetical protein
MLREVGEALAAALEEIFVQIEFYEGQFEALTKRCNPPACYIEYIMGEPAEDNEPLGKLNLVLHVHTSGWSEIPAICWIFWKASLPRCMTKGLGHQEHISGQGFCGQFPQHDSARWIIGF